MKKKIKNKIEFFFFKQCYRLLKRFSYQTTEYILTRLFVLIGFYGNVRRQVADENLAAVFPFFSHYERNMILKRMYFFMGKTIAEIYFEDSNKLFENAEIRGWENLQQAADKKKGLILATMHSGNWEMAGAYIAQKYPLSVIYKKQRNEYFDQFTNDLRAHQNIEIIRYNRSLKQVFRVLRENKILAILMDQDAGKKGILTNFLGRPASTYAGTAKIALKTGVPIVPAIAVRDRQGNNIFILEPMIDPDQYEKKDVRKLTEAVSSVLEKYILQYPHHWFWVHRRWKSAHKVMNKE